MEGVRGEVCIMQGEVEERKGEEGAGRGGEGRWRAEDGEGKKGRDGERIYLGLPRVRLRLEHLGQNILRLERRPRLSRSPLQQRVPISSSEAKGRRSVGRGKGMRGRMGGWNREEEG